MFHNRRWRDDRRGTAVALVALFLPIAAILLAAMVDLGMALAHREKLIATASFAAEAGAVVVGDLIVEKAAAHNPPPEATNPLIYLTNEDRQDIAQDSRVLQAVEDSISQNRAGLPPLAKTPVLSYPDNTVDCDGTADQKRIDLRVELADSRVAIFPNLLFGESNTEIEGKAIQSVQICP